METKAYYAIVGLFVIILSTIGLIIALWLSVGLHTQKYTNYLVYFNESVTGLSLSAPVKYNGVDVGFVKNITLVTNNPNQVAIVIAVKQHTPVTTATRARLNMQGVTGIAYIELRGSSNQATTLTTALGQKYPVIPSSPSLLFRMDAAIDQLSENIQKITGGISAVFNDKNSQLLQQSLSNIELISQNLQENSGALTRIIKNTDILFNNAASASKDIPIIINDAKNSIKNGNVTLQTINDQVLPLLTDLLVNVDGVTLQLHDFTAELTDNPAILIRGKTPPLLGPGEYNIVTKDRR